MLINKDATPPTDRSATSNLAKLNERLEAARIVPAPTERPLVQRGYAWLQNEFQQVLKQTRNLVGKDRLGASEFRPLAHLGQQSLELSKVIHGEFQRLDLPDATSLAPTVLLKQMLDECRDLLDLIQRQLLLLEGVEQWADEIHAIFDSLIQNQPRLFESVQYKQISDLTSRLIRRRMVPHVTESSPLYLPMAIERLTSRHGATMARAYTIGISTAQEVGQIARRQWLRKEQIQTVTAAALLQDIGCLLVQPELLPEKTPEVEKTQLMKQHPAVGAALVNGFNGAPAILGRIISQHHERVNGSGFPRGRSGADLSDLSRLVMTTCRFQELRLKTARPRHLGLPASQSDLAAANILLMEARQGELDRKWVDQCLAHLDPQSLNLGFGDLATSSSHELDEKTFILEGPEPHWPPTPHGPNAPHIASESGPSKVNRVHSYHD